MLKGTFFGKYGYGACTIIHADDTQPTKRARQYMHGKTYTIKRTRRRDVPRRVSTTRWVSRGGFSRGGFSRGGVHAVGFHAVGGYAVGCTRWVIFPHISNAYVSARQYIPTIHKRQYMPTIHARQNVPDKTYTAKRTR